MKLWGATFAALLLVGCTSSNDASAPRGPIHAGMATYVTAVRLFWPPTETETSAELVHLGRRSCALLDSGDDYDAAVASIESIEGVTRAVARLEVIAAVRDLCADAAGLLP